MTVVQLDQHTLPGHSLAAYPVLGRTPSPRTAQTGVDQDAPKPSPADALAFAEQLTEMGVVGSRVHRASQVNHPASGRFGNSVGLAAPVSTGKGCSAFLPVSRQDAPGVARAHSRQLGRLIQRNLLCH